MLNSNCSRISPPLHISVFTHIVIVELDCMQRIAATMPLNLLIAGAFRKTRILYVTHQHSTFHPGPVGPVLNSSSTGLQTPSPNNPLEIKKKNKQNYDGPGTRMRKGHKWWSGQITLIIGSTQRVFCCSVAVFLSVCLLIHLSPLRDVRITNMPRGESHIILCYAWKLAGEWVGVERRCRI